MNSILGVQVQIIPDQPRYQLPTDLLLPPGFREEFDAWARGYLGSTNMLRDGEVLYSGPGPKSIFYLNPRTWAQMRQQLSKDID